MTRKTLILISSSSQAMPPQLVDTVCRHWPKAHRPDICTYSINQILNDESLLNHCALAWIFVTEGPVDRLYELISILQDRHAPVLLTREGEIFLLAEQFQEGVIIGPPDASPEALCAVLRTLWAQGTLIKGLQSEVAILRANQGGLCDQIGKIDEELRLAAKLQREFLPPVMSSSENLEVQVLYRPASYISGDIYDITRFDDQHVGFFVADAVGHGVPAALMTMYIKRSLHMKHADSQVEDGDHIVSPNKALAQLNQEILDHQSGNRIRTATACYGLLNFKTLKLTVPRDCPPYPLVFRANGAVDVLRPEGAMLGLFQDEQYEIISLQLHCGDRVLFYSDGFDMISPNPDYTDGAEAPYPFVEIFKNLGAGTMADAMHSLTAHLNRQVGSLNQSDDLTALLVGVPMNPLADDIPLVAPSSLAVR